jgi:hypothetical protein
MGRVCHPPRSHFSAFPRAQTPYANTVDEAFSRASPWQTPTCHASARPPPPHFLTCASRAGTGFKSSLHHSSDIAIACPRPHAAAAPSSRATPQRPFKPRPARLTHRSNRNYHEKAQGSRLKAQGSRLKAQGSRLKAQGSRLKAQGSKLKAQSSRLKAQGSRLKTKDQRLTTKDSKT